MAKTKDALPALSHNIKPLLKEIKDAIGQLDALGDRRSNASADKAAIIARLEKKGINKRALKFVMQYAGWTESQRRNFDESYELIRQAIGEPLQGSLPLKNAAE